MGMDGDAWFVYVLRCGDGSLYTGATSDVSRRLGEHQAGQGGRYTRAHLPVRLVAVWRFPDRAAALSAEAHFKQFGRSRKLAFVREQRRFRHAPFALAVMREARKQAG